MQEKNCRVCNALAILRMPSQHCLLLQGLLATARNTLLLLFSGGGLEKEPGGRRQPSDQRNGGRAKGGKKHPVRRAIFCSR
jgi:hypothetical protein